jgi:hypothetical protein
MIDTSFVDKTDRINNGIQNTAVIDKKRNIASMIGAKIKPYA